VDFAGKGRRVSQDSNINRCGLRVVLEQNRFWWFSFLSPLVIAILLMFIFPLRASLSFASEKKIKIHFSRQIVVKMHRSFNHFSLQNIT